MPSPWRTDGQTDTKWCIGAHHALAQVGSKNEGGLGATPPKPSNTFKKLKHQISNKTHLRDPNPHLPPKNFLYRFTLISGMVLGVGKNLKSDIIWRFSSPIKLTIKANNWTENLASMIHKHQQTNGRTESQMVAIKCVRVFKTSTTFRCGAKTCTNLKRIDLVFVVLSISLQFIHVNGRKPRK